MTGIITYFKESFEELKNNVTPPTFSQGQSLTILVADFLNYIFINYLGN